MVKNKDPTETASIDPRSSDSWHSPLVKTSGADKAHGEVPCHRQQQGAERLMFSPDIVEGQHVPSRHTVVGRQ